MAKTLVFPLRELSPDMKSFCLGGLHQVCLVLHTINFYRELLQKFQEFAPSTPRLKEGLSFQVINLDQWRYWLVRSSRMVEEPPPARITSR